VYNHSGHILIEIVKDNIKNVTCRIGNKKIWSIYLFL